MDSFSYEWPVRNIIPKEEQLVQKLKGKSKEILEIENRLIKDKRIGINIGLLEGAILGVLASQKNVEKIVEIGSQYGCSGTYMAQALGNKGQIFLLENDEKCLKELQSTFFMEEKCKFSCQIHILPGVASETLNSLEKEGPFDLVFIDADKAGYLNYYEWACRNLRQGGYLVADNVFLFGAMFEDEPPKGVSKKSFKVMKSFLSDFFDNTDFQTSLEVRAKGGSGPSILKGTSLKLSEGKIHGLVGPSGSGKSTLCQSILRLVESFRYSGSIQFEKKNLLELSEKELRQIRGRKISMIFQNPASAFNPYMKIGPQLSEALLAHDLLNKKDARKKVLELMEKVGVLNGESRYEDYSSQFSGGELQRLMIASAVSCGPKLVLADEPTTALDASLQIQILELLKELTQQLGHTLLVVSHDFSMISSFCEEIHFMELGKIVESGEIKKILEWDPHRTVL